MTPHIEIYHLRLMEACNTYWKHKYIAGEISLSQYLKKEKEFLRELNN